MKMYLISDNTDTCIGMKLAGVDGVVAHSYSHVKEELQRALQDKSIGIILITEKLSKDYPDLVSDIKLNRYMPLIIEIPDRHGTGRSPDFITSYIKEAIGLKL